ncbi:MAG: multicopper oxidase domain-containing protein [Planctomycetota bacterium]|jgi:spore coat protein A
MKVYPSLLAAVGAAAVVAGAARADQVVFDASKDNTLYEDADGDLSNGIGEHLFAGRTLQGPGDDKRRGLVAFDLAGSIPAGSTVNSVTLTLRMSRSNQAGNENVSVHRVLSDWGEGASDAGGQEGSGAAAEPGDATWIHTFWDTQLWSSAGGDFVGGASATTNVGGNGSYGWTSAQMVADVQAWVDDPGSNYGWIVVGNESTAPTAKRFDSQQNSQQSRRPKLTVDFTPPADTGACCFGDGNCQVLTQSDCSNQGGAYEGDGTDCDPNPCPQPTGACCFGDGSCLVLEPGDCSDQGGNYQGDDTDCNPNPCPVETGACCFNNGNCTVVSESDCTDQGGAYQGNDIACTPGLCPVILEPFVDPLPIPPVLQPVSGSPGGEASYEVSMTQFTQQLHRDLPDTTVYGYAGSYPSSTIEAGRDLPVTVTWMNNLPAEGHFLPVDTCPHGAEDNSSRAVVHLHGGHVPAEFDGYPEDTFLPGQQAVYVYPNNQLPATLWFHDHALGITRLNVMMGLAGFYLLRDQFEIDLDLPEGEFEIPMVIQDRSFNPDGSFMYPAQWQEDFFGDTILVNGKVWPFLNVDRGKYRFRLLNGSNTRTYTLALSDGAPFQQIGTDGGLLPAPVTLNEVTLASGERADVVMDFESYPPGTEIILTNSAPAPFPGQPGEGVIPNVMKFIVGSNPGYTTAVPDELRPLETLDEQDSLRSRDFILRRETDPCSGTRWLINGLGWEDITERTRLDTIEIWEFINRSGMVHPMHMHLVFVQVLDRQAFVVIDDEIVPIGDPIPPDPNEAGWKDTVRANPQEITRVIALFEDYTGLYPYHCHILEHEDHEMMRQFQSLPACPWDLDLDDFVGINDLLDLLAAWGPNPGSPADFDDDGFVGIKDLLALLANWGSCPQ